MATKIISSDSLLAYKPGTAKTCLLHRPYVFLVLQYILFTQVRSAGQLLGVAPPWRHFMLNGATMAPP